MKTEIFRVVLLCLIFSHTVCSQTSNTINKGEYMNKLHESYAGRIAFMESFVSFDDFSEKDFKNEITLTNDSEINIRIFLDNTLAFSLSQMAPNLSLEELCEKGNFLFSFSVDDKVIYNQKLPYGAGSCDFKNQQTVYGVPFVHKDNPDHWGRFLWQRFLYQNDGDEALAPGNHELKIIVKPYLDLDSSTIIGDIIAEGSVIINRKLKEISEKEIAIQPIEKSEFGISKESINEELIRDLNKKILQNEFKKITSIAVVKNGKLILEEYFNDASRKTLHDTRSLTKSFTSTLVGVAIDKGYLESTSTTLADYYELAKYKNMSQQKEKVSLEHLLIMSSGFEGDDSDMSSQGNEEYMYPASDWVNFALNLPIDSGKTGQWQYFTAGVVILGDILNQHTPRGLEQFAKSNLFEPLGIKEVTWQYTPSKVPNTAGSCQVNTLALAKYGQMYLNNGSWKGQRIISEKWVEKSLTDHKSIHNNQTYGYLFWGKEFDFGEKKVKAYTASGNGGNHVIMIKELDTVIVITATAYNVPYAHTQVNEIVEKYLLPSINY